MEPKIGETRRNVWKRHGMLISQLVEHLKNRRNVNKETVRLAGKISSSFDRMQRLDKWFHESVIEEIEVEAPSKGKGVVGQSPKPKRSGVKRKDRTPPSMEDDQTKKKAQQKELQNLTFEKPQLEKPIEDGPKEQGWTTTGKKKKKIKG